MNNSDLRIGLWGESDSLLTSAQAREKLKIADQLGYDSVWFDDATGFDEVTLLGEAVRGTERMKIGTAIMSVFTRSPTVLAQTFASLDLLSGGRMVIGLGASSAEYLNRVHGVPSFVRPLQRLREYVEIINLIDARDSPTEEGSQTTSLPGVPIKSCQVGIITKRGWVVAIAGLSAVTFAVSDMARALAFYRALGFRVKYGGETSSFASLVAGASFLNLIHVPNADVRWWGRAIFYVDDVDAQYRRALDAGITPMFAPQDARWGERYFHVTDPDGHEVSFAKPL